MMVFFELYAGVRRAPPSNLEILMKRAFATSLMAAALLAGGAAPAVAAQAASIPLSLSVTASPSEVTSGGSVTVEVHLKNYRGDTVAASESLIVTVHSELSGDASVPFKIGQSVAQIEVRFHRSGVGTLVATAPNITSGSAPVVVHAEESAKSTAVPSAAARARAEASPPSTAPAPSRTAPAAPDAAPQRILLAVDVLPDHVHPLNASWKTNVLVTAVNESRQPIAVPVVTAIYLATDAGIVMPATATIQVGHARSTEQIQLISNRAGTGTLWAWTDSGELGRAAVEYHNPVPELLAVKALPTRTLNDGRAAIHVTVFLQDETSRTARAEEDMKVQLTSSVGSPTPSTLSIAKGQFVGEAILTSATAGVAEITATAPGLKSGVASVEFVFPYFLVLVAALGGVVGALVRSSGVSFTGKWWWHLLGSLGIGSVLGLLFYLLAAFGIVASIPKLSIPFGQLPTTNEFAALVLGFFGGYYARAWLPNPGDVPPADAAAPAVPNR